MATFLITILLFTLILRVRGMDWWRIMEWDAAVIWIIVVVQHAMTAGLIDL